MRGGEAIIESLKNMGVKTIFGYPGGQTIPFYDMLYDADIEHILVRHEQCAAHAADGYARASGRVGVCLATSGPGATNWYWNSLYGFFSYCGNYWTSSYPFNRK